MLCPAVSVAAAAIWLLAVPGPGLSLPAEDNSETDFRLCRHCFYRQTPPQGASAGPLLRPLCHRLPGGQAFATLSKPDCDTNVYSAFYLSRGLTERGGEEGGELVTEEEEESIKVAVPALLGGGGDASHPVSPTDSQVQHWDSTVSTLVQSSITPQCSTLEGDLYILTGAGDLRAAEDEDTKCQTELLWSAVCCAVPEGKSGFSVGLIREAGEAARQVSVKELGEMLGVAELFLEGCGGTDGETVGITVDLHSEGLLGNTEKLVEDPNNLIDSTDSNQVYDVDSNTAGQVTKEEEVGSDATSQGPKEDIKGSIQALITEEQVAGVDAQPEEADVADMTQETSADAVTSESDGEGQRGVSSAEHETVDEQEADTNSSSILVYILSTTLSILKTPLRPLFSTITQLPGQVTYVLQEDLGVLTTLPVDTFSLLHLLTSDLLSWMGSAAEMLLGIGETCFCGVYYCTSSMIGTLMNNCYNGVTGMGTLAGDSVGIFGNAFDNSWWATKFFGGRLWEQSEGYVGTVMSEMGGQAKAVGGGFGRLVWRSGKGVVNVFRLGGGLIMGMVDMVTGAVSEAFGQESN